MSWEPVPGADYMEMAELTERLVYKLREQRGTIGLQVEPGIWQRMVKEAPPKSLEFERIEDRCAVVMPIAGRYFRLYAVDGISSDEVRYRMEAK